MNKQLKHEVTPLGMLNNAKVWYVLYRQNIYLGTHHKIIAIYCLLISFEMFLKSYLIYLNKMEYSCDSNLEKLGHKFGNIVKAIKKEKDARLSPRIDSLIKKYDLMSIDTNNLRYPRKGDEFLIHAGYLSPHNEFDELLDAIGGEVSGGIVDKFYDET
ncbi:MAG: hypothetical protein NUV69_01505 [Candidatus Curtissbacteria bacterium]|nr:hypothetical protein [Candidatus Curtissbacteria bacterium]